MADCWVSFQTLQIIMLWVSLLIKYCHFGLIGQAGHQPNVAVFDELGMRLKNQLIHKLDF